jgi:hypothetical protein
MKSDLVDEEIKYAFSSDETNLENKEQAQSLNNL